MRRTLTLLALAAVGLAVGYLAARSGGEGAGASVPDASAAAGGPAASSGTPGALPAAGGSPAAGAGDGVLPPARGSSFTVVGGMTREELARHGILPQPPAGTAPESGMRDEMDGPPAALAFPEAVRASAARYWCLCGCGHILAECPCNDQPIGAVTMLSHLGRLLDSGLAGPELDAAMVDRYGPRVLVASDEP